MDTRKDNPTEQQLIENTSRLFEIMGIKSIIKHIECERDLHLKPKPPNQCINRYQDGRCDITGHWCIKIYPFDCPYVVKFAHYKKIIRDAESR